MRDAAGAKGSSRKQKTPGRRAAAPPAAPAASPAGEPTAKRVPGSALLGVRPAPADESLL